MKCVAFAFVALLLAFSYQSASALTVTTVPDAVTYQVLPSDDLVILSNQSVADLPDVLTVCGKEITFKKGDKTSGPDTVLPFGSQTIDYQTKLIVAIGGDGYTIVADCTATMWRATHQLRKNLPLSHRTVVASVVDQFGNWHADTCRDDEEFIRISADGTANGIAVYLDTPSGCNPGLPYINTTFMCFEDVSTDLTKPISINPNGFAINGSAAPIYLKQSHEAFCLYSDGNEWVITSYVNPSDGPARSW